MSDKIATGIKTELWYNMLESLRKKGWKLVREYNQFDKGIDFDMYELKLKDERIYFVWDNWFEGEIRCGEARMIQLQAEFQTDFNFDTPEHLSEENLAKMLPMLRRKLF